MGNLEFKFGKLFDDFCSESYVFWKVNVLKLSVDMSTVGCDNIHNNYR